MPLAFRGCHCAAHAHARARARATGASYPTDHSFDFDDLGYN